MSSHTEQNTAPTATHEAQEIEEAMDVEPENPASIYEDLVAIDFPFLESDEIMSAVEDIDLAAPRAEYDSGARQGSGVPTLHVDAAMFTSVSDEKLEQGEARLRKGQKASNTARLTLQKMCHVRGIRIFSDGGKALTKKVLWRSLEEWVRAQYAI